jgi:hypothetical protein
MSGEPHQKSISKAFPINRDLIIELFIPFILGIIAITAHARFKMHLGIPGHHGLIFMALLLIARKTSRIKWSSLLFSIGVGSMLYIPFLGFNDPFVLFVYIWPGILFDLFYVPNTDKQPKLWFIAIIGGIAYSTIPFSRYIIGLLTGLIHKSVFTGMLMPFFSFFLFGLSGALLGFGAYHLIKKISKK